MICTNEKCKKNFDEPLELYDGSWACPHCRKEMTDALKEFEITPESNELFVLSERHYFDWLTSDPDSRTDTKNKSVEKAVELCKRAAMLGDPRAVTRLGYYYDKDYVEIERTEAERCRIAYSYYSSVCYSDGGKNIDSEQWKDIREYAARLMLNMLAYVPAEIAELKKFKFDENCNRVHSMLGVKFDESIRETKKISRSERMLETFYSCFSATRAPLFGVCRLSGKELYDVFAASEAEEKTGRKSVYGLINDGLKICYVVSEEIATSKAKFVKLSGESNIKTRLNELRGDDVTVHVFFFNECGKHRFFKGATLKSIGKELEKKNYALVSRLLDVGRKQDYTFFDDDVYRHKSNSRTSVATALTNLIDNITTGGKE